MKTISKELTEIFEQLEFDEFCKLYRDYSGRCMYGRQCFGFIDSDQYNSYQVIGELIACAFQVDQDNLNEDGELEVDSLTEEVADLLKNTRQDSMGINSIIYFPDYQLHTENDLNKAAVV